MLPDPVIRMLRVVAESIVMTVEQMMVVVDCEELAFLVQMLDNGKTEGVCSCAESSVLNYL